MLSWSGLKRLLVLIMGAGFVSENEELTRTAVGIGFAVVLSDAVAKAGKQLFLQAA